VTTLLRRNDGDSGPKFFDDFKRRSLNGMTLKLSEQANKLEVEENQDRFSSHIRWILTQKSKIGNQKASFEDTFKNIIRQVSFYILDGKKSSLNPVVHGNKVDSEKAKFFKLASNFSNGSNNSDNKKKPQPSLKSLDQVLKIKIDFLNYRY
jgi:hypothetical protein